MNAPRVRHAPARAITGADIGQRVAITMQGRTLAGGLSDVAQHPTAGRTQLWLGGHPELDVRNDTAVTIGDLDVIGGAR